jgi:RNA polymerase sigma-70 factor, ECF subfamily
MFDGPVPERASFRAWEDKDLAIAFKDGRADAYDAIHDRYAARVHGVCRRMLGREQDAQDAAQETFLRVYQALGRFNGRYQLGAWITRIATNVCLDQLRSRSRRPVEFAELESIEAESEHLKDLDDPEFLVLRNAEGRKVRRVLGQLPPLHRAAIVLRDFEGLSYEEIAVVLNLRECQVKALIHRARQGFKRNWVSSLAGIFIPARLLERVRKVETPVASHPAGGARSIQYVAETVTSAAGPAASSCSAAFSQCGQFVAERIMPAMAAVAVGAASLAPPAAALVSRPHDPSPDLSSGVTVSRASASVDDPAREDRERSAAPADGRDPETDPPSPPEGAEEPVAEDTVTEPVPAGSPTPAESPSVGTEAPPPEKSPPDQEPPAPAEPQGFSFSFSSDVAFDGRSCDCLGPTTLVYETSTSDEEDGLTEFSQAVEGTATAAGSPSLGLRLRHASEPTRPYSAVFVLETREGDYTYEVEGQLVGRERTSWGGWSYVYRGGYELSSRPSQGESVPVQGIYSASVVVSTTQDRIVSLDVGLSESG